VPAAFNAKLLVTRLVSDHVHPLLAPLGFRKSRNSFWRLDADGRCDVLTFQMSRWGTSTRSDVIAFGGVYFPDVERLANPSPRPTPPPYYQCTISRSFGRHVGPTERAWPVGRDVDPAVLAESLRASARRAVSWLNRSHSLTAILRRPGTGQTPPTFHCRVAALHLLGQHEKVRAELARAQALYLEDPDLHDDLPPFLRRLGVQPPPPPRHANRNK
jgi:hypothetical protein